MVVLGLIILKEESSKLTGSSSPITQDSARDLRGFYEFRCEILQQSDESQILPTNKTQVKPFIAYLKKPEEAIKILENCLF